MHVGLLIRRFGFNSHLARGYSFMEIDHEIFSIAILSLQLILEGQLSAAGKQCAQELVNCLED